MTERQLFFASASELADRVRRREISPLELMEATLRRIEELNPRINAFVSMYPAERLLEEARAATERLARGEDLGPFGGLPLGVKDLEDLRGLPNTHGSLLFRDSVAERDTIQVERLRRAGAIPIGKTNTPEFGYTAFTTNRIFGPTRNPWKLDRTPGGSSGGSSAALAAGMVPLATASDGGGSVRIPASFTGLVGLKPSLGRIPWGPEESLRVSGAIVSGPLTRSVRDAALWLDVTAGPHDLDPYSLPRPEASYVEAMNRDPGPLRIAYNPTFGYATVAADVHREVEAALRALEDCGHRVEVVEQPIPDVVVHWVMLMAGEDFGIRGQLLEEKKELLDPGYLPGMEIGRRLTAETLGEIQRMRTQLVALLAGIFERFDLLASPTVATPPFAAEGPLPAEVDGRPLTSAGGMIAFTYPFNFSGNPAISLRAGFTSEGLPVGLQLVARRLREDLLLQVARQYEQARPWSDHWPDI